MGKGQRVKGEEEKGGRKQVADGSRIADFLKSRQPRAKASWN